MNSKQSLFGAALALVFATLTAQADEADEAAVRAGMAKLLPDMELGELVKAPVPGLYELMLGARVFYVSEDGRYLIQGSVIDIETRENLTEARQAVAKKATMDQVSEDSMVIFAPEEYKHTITVFTDIDCGYCRKLHREIGDYMAEGIRVRYLFYPRAGIGSPSYQKAVNVWCADDRKQAMTDAKSGKELENRQCENPVKDHYVLGDVMGVTGTPAVVLEDGRLLPGYVPAKRMAAYLESPK
jgi:thiol:disulfide interchange protein DsbC